MYFWWFHVNLNIFHRWCFFFKFNTVSKLLKILKSSENINKFLKPSAWKVLDHLEQLRTVLRQSRKFWNYLAIFGQPWDCKECFEIIWKCPDKFETGWKGHLEIFRQFWNCPENLKSSVNVQTALKPTGRFWSHPERSVQFWNCPESIETIRRDQDSFETIRKVLGPSGNIGTVLKLFGRFWNSREKNGQFQNCPVRFETI